MNFYFKYICTCKYVTITCCLSFWISCFSVSSSLAYCFTWLALACSSLVAVSTFTFKSTTTLCASRIRFQWTISKSARFVWCFSSSTFAVSRSSLTLSSSWRFFQSSSRTKCVPYFRSSTCISYLYVAISWSLQLVSWAIFFSMSATLLFALSQSFLSSSKSDLYVITYMCVIYSACTCTSSCSVKYSWPTRISTQIKVHSPRSASLPGLEESHTDSVILAFLYSKIGVAPVQR